MGEIQVRAVNGGEVKGSLEAGCFFSLPALGDGRYMLAQIDDYMHLPRSGFPHQPPIRIYLEAQVSAADLPGTWGFGLWNDPFSFGFGAGGMSRVLPELPNAAWFFYGSSGNFLSLRDDQPASGFHAKTFSSPLIPSLFSLGAIPELPLLLWKGGRKWARRVSRWFVQEEAAPIDICVNDWHAYELLWERDRVTFFVDGDIHLKTSISPRGKLGLVIWIDNQFFRFTLEGEIGFGFQPTGRSHWMVVREFSMIHGWG